MRKGMFNLKILPKITLKKLVVPITGKAEMTGEIAIAKAIFSFDMPCVSCLRIGLITNFLHILESLPGFF